MKGSPLTPEQAVETIDRTMRLLFRDVIEPQIHAEVARRVDEKLHDHVRYVLNSDGFLWPVRRVWRWRSWELSLGRRPKR